MKPLPTTLLALVILVTRLGPGAALAPAQSPPAPPPVPEASAAPYSEQTRAELTRLHAAALESSYAYRQVAHLANNVGPRLSGSPQAQRAVDYVADELRALGLEVTLEPTMVPHWVRGEETAALVRFPGMAENTTQRVVLTALGGSVATPPAGLTAEVVVARDFAELARLGRARVEGRIVLFNVPFDRRLAAQGRGVEAYGQAVVYRSNGPVAAGRLGAAAVLVRSVGGAEYRLPHTGATRYADDVPRIPAAAVTAEDADLLAALTAQGPVTMRLVLTPRQLPDAPSFNVVADLKGSEEPAQVVLVSGHLDSWDLGTGAIDDGAGVAVAMETAHLVRQLGLRPRRTIRVVAWMNEENGGMGGKTYARDHAAELPAHFAAMEIDLGAGHPLGLSLNARPGARALLAPVSELLRDASGAGLLVAAEETGADLHGLEQAGVPTLAPIQDSRTYFDYHHTAADTLDKINPRELAENAALTAVTIYALANLVPPLPR